MRKTGSLHDEIIRVAYDLYEEGGCVHGYHLEHWLEAERIVLQGHAMAIEQVPNTAGSTKGKKASGKSETKTRKTSKKTSDSSSQIKTRKSPRKKSM